MKAYFLSVLTLLAVLSLALWNSASMAGRTQRWQGQLDQVEALATDGAWEDAYQALEESYGDWSSSQAYLHIVSHHDVLDEAEAMYRRAAVFICLQEESSLLGELSDLRHQLRLLSEMEQLSIKNVLQHGAYYSIRPMAVQAYHFRYKRIPDATAPGTPLFW